MNNEVKEFPLYAWNDETKEFWFLGQKIDCVHNPDEWKKYLNDLVSKNKELETSIATKDSELLQLKEELRQLKTNRDEAIEYIKHSWWLRTDQTYDTSKDLKDWEAKEILSILERGKE